MTIAEAGSLPPVICVGAAMWDIIARTDEAPYPGADLPGRVLRRPGGVALNIAIALAAEGQRPALLSAIGGDRDGDELLAVARADGVGCAWVTRVPDATTGRFICIEGPDGEPHAAVADCRVLDTAGAAVCEPLLDGRLGSADAPYPGTLVIDGNLPADLLTRLAGPGTILVPASNGKAERLAGAMARGAGLCVNLGEARIIAGQPFADSKAAARYLAGMGASLVAVTDGSRAAVLAEGATLVTAMPPKVAVASTTGAGDRFLAGLLAARLSGLDAETALSRAVAAAARHVAPPSPAAGVTRTA